MRNTPGGERGRWATLVQAVREASRLTKVELARRLEVDRVTVHRWETGTYRPDSPDVVKRFADLFGLDLDDALVTAGFRPETAAKDEPLRQRLDPALADAQAMLDDPTVSDETKAQVHAMLQVIIEMARQQPRKPRRRAG